MKLIRTKRVILRIIRIRLSIRKNRINQDLRQNCQYIFFYGGGAQLRASSCRLEEGSGRVY